jgi:transcriptional regulator of heat shock response
MSLIYKPQIPITSIDDIEDPRTFIELMKEQRRWDRELPIENQVGIGEELEYIKMEDSRILVSTIYSFEP